MIPSAQGVKRYDIFILIGIFLLSLILRLYAFQYAPIINADGVRYINQAKALSIGNWELARSCGHDFISLYNLLIPISQVVVGDWIVAAKSISLVFGTISIIPLYFLLKQFFRTSITAIVSFAFAIHPFFIAYSTAAIKDPISWFFALLGMVFFIYGIRADKKEYYLIASNVSFLIGGLARFELLIYIVGSILYIVLFEREKTKKTLFFTLPLMLTCLFVFGYHSRSDSGDISIWSFYILPRVQHFFGDFAVRLPNAEIFSKAMIAVGLLVSKPLKVLSVQLIPFLCMGILTVGRKMRGNRDFRYFLLLAFLSAVALFLFYIKWGVLSPRYTVFVILPLMILIALGIERILLFFTERGFRESPIFWTIGFYMVITAVLFPSESILGKTDKFIYKKVGEYVEATHKNRPIFIIAPDPRVIFYANLHSPVIECRHLQVPYETLKKLSYGDLVATLRANAAEYFLWSKKEWKNAHYDFLYTALPEHFQEVMRWDSEQDKLILFKVVY